MAVIESALAGGSLAISWLISAAVGLTLSTVLVGCACCKCHRKPKNRQIDEGDVYAPVSHSGVGGVKQQSPASRPGVAVRDNTTPLQPRSKPYNDNMGFDSKPYLSGRPLSQRALPTVPYEPSPVTQHSRVDIDGHNNLARPLGTHRLIVGETDANANNSPGGNLASSPLTRDSSRSEMYATVEKSAAPAAGPPVAGSLDVARTFAHVSGQTPMPAPPNNTGWPGAKVTTTHNVVTIVDESITVARAKRAQQLELADERAAALQAGGAARAAAAANSGDVIDSPHLYAQVVDKPGAESAPQQTGVGGDVGREKHLYEYPIFSRRPQACSNGAAASSDRHFDKKGPIGACEDAYSSLSTSSDGYYGRIKDGPAGGAPVQPMDEPWYSRIDENSRTANRAAAAATSAATQAAQNRPANDQARLQAPSHFAGVPDDRPATSSGHPSSGAAPERHPSATPADGADDIYGSQTSSKREPSYKYITVRESLDVLRERMAQQGRLAESGSGPAALHTRPEHYYSSIEGSEHAYETVVGGEPASPAQHLYEDITQVARGRGDPVQQEEGYGRRPAAQTGAPDSHTRSDPDGYAYVLHDKKAQEAKKNQQAPTPSAGAAAAHSTSAHSTSPPPPEPPARPSGLRPLSGDVQRLMEEAAGRPNPPTSPIPDRSPAHTQVRVAAIADAKGQSAAAPGDEYSRVDKTRKSLFEDTSPPTSAPAGTRDAHGYEIVPDRAAGRRTSKPDNTRPDESYFDAPSEGQHASHKPTCSAADLYTEITNRHSNDFDAAQKKGTPAERQPVQSESAVIYPRPPTDDNSELYSEPHSHKFDQFRPDDQNTETWSILGPAQSNRQDSAHQPSVQKQEATRRQETADKQAPVAAFEKGFNTTSEQIGPQETVFYDAKGAQNGQAIVNGRSIDGPVIHDRENQPSVQKPEPVLQQQETVENREHVQEPAYEKPLIATSDQLQRQETVFYDAKNGRNGRETWNEYRIDSAGSDNRANQPAVQNREPTQSERSAEKREPMQKQETTDKQVPVQKPAVEKHFDATSDKFQRQETVFYDAKNGRNGQETMNAHPIDGAATNNRPTNSTDILDSNRSTAQGDKRARRGSPQKQATLYYDAQGESLAEATAVDKKFDAAVPPRREPELAQPVNEPGSAAENFIEPTRTDDRNSWADASTRANDTVLLHDLDSVHQQKEAVNGREFGNESIRHEDKFDNAKSTDIVDDSSTELNMTSGSTTNASKEPGMNNREKVPISTSKYYPQSDTETEPSSAPGSTTTSTTSPSSMIHSTGTKADATSKYYPQSDTETEASSAPDSVKTSTTAKSAIQPHSTGTKADATSKYYPQSDTETEASSAPDSVKTSSTAKSAIQPHSTGTKADATSKYYPQSDTETEASSAPDSVKTSTTAKSAIQPYSTGTKADTMSEFYPQSDTETEPSSALESTETSITTPSTMRHLNGTKADTAAKYYPQSDTETEHSSAPESIETSTTAKSAIQAHSTSTKADTTISSLSSYNPSSTTFERMDSSSSYATVESGATGQTGSDVFTMANEPANKVPGLRRHDELGGGDAESTGLADDKQQSRGRRPQIRTDGGSRPVPKSAQTAGGTVKVDPSEWRGKSVARPAAAAAEQLTTFAAGAAKADKAGEQRGATAQRPTSPVKGSGSPRRQHSPGKGGASPPREARTASPAKGSRSPAPQPRPTSVIPSTAQYRAQAAEARKQMLQQLPGDTSAKTHPKTSRSPEMSPSRGRGVSRSPATSPSRGAYTPKSSANSPRRGSRGYSKSPATSPHRSGGGFAVNHLNASPGGGGGGAPVTRSPDTSPRRFPQAKVDSAAPDDYVHRNWPSPGYREAPTGPLAKESMSIEIYGANPNSPDSVFSSVHRQARGQTGLSPSSGTSPTADSGLDTPWGHSRNSAQRGPPQHRPHEWLDETPGVWPHGHPPGEGSRTVEGPLVHPARRDGADRGRPDGAYVYRAGDRADLIGPRRTHLSRGEGLPLFDSDPLISGGFGGGGRPDDSEQRGGLRSAFDSSGAAQCFRHARAVARVAPTATAGGSDTNTGDQCPLHGGQNKEKAAKAAGAGDAFACYCHSHGDKPIDPEIVEKANLYQFEHAEVLFLSRLDSV